MSKRGSHENSPDFYRAIDARLQREAEREALMAQPKVCICPKSVIIDGVEYEGGVRNPSCIEHGLRTRWPSAIGNVSAESSRTRGITHAGHRS